MQVHSCDFVENWHKTEATSGARSNRLLTKLKANTTFSILSHSRKKCQLKHVPHNILVQNIMIIEVFFPFFLTEVAFTKSRFHLRSISLIVYSWGRKAKG